LEIGIYTALNRTVRASPQRMSFTTLGTQRGNLVCILPVWLGYINFFRVIKSNQKGGTNLEG
jgi:hypothetical protein